MLDESDMPVSVRASSDSNRAADRVATRLSSDPRVYRVTLMAGARWATHFDTDPALAHAVTTAAKRAKDAHLPGSADLSKAWEDMINLPGDMQDDEGSDAAKAAQRQAATVFPRQRFEHLDEAAQQFLAAVSDACE